MEDPLRQGPLSWVSQGDIILTSSLRTPNGWLGRYYWLDTFNYNWEKTKNKEKQRKMKKVNEIKLSSVEKQTKNGD